MKVADRWVLPLSKGKDNAVLVVRETGRGRDKDWEEFLEELDQDQKKRKAPFWRARAIRRATLRFYRRKEIWLIGERRDTAQDNSLHLFTYLRQHERRRKAYYIIEKGSADRAKLKRLGNVVAHSSWKHKLLMLHASLLINAYDIDSYMLPDGWDRTKYLKHLNWRIGARRVFLQHGVTDEDGSKALHRNRTGVDLVFATSDREAEHFSEHMHYGDQAKALGFPRFDALQPDRGRRRVLLMPTWLEHLIIPTSSRTVPTRTRSTKSFRESTYREFMVQLLRHPSDAGAGAHSPLCAPLPSALRDAEHGRRSGAGPPTGAAPGPDQSQRADGAAPVRPVHHRLVLGPLRHGLPRHAARLRPVRPGRYWAKHARKGYFEAAYDGLGRCAATSRKW
ncbi:CDP-glycerol glycerophosphotransferase family protein [Streptomyces violaceorubidus]